MFLLAKDAPIGGPAKYMWVAERSAPYDEIAGAPYSANGYHRHANRAGWAKFFGGAERDWQDYEHVAKTSPNEHVAKRARRQNVAKRARKSASGRQGF